MLQLRHEWKFRRTTSSVETLAAFKYIPEVKFFACCKLFLCLALKPNFCIRDTIPVFESEEWSSQEACDDHTSLSSTTTVHIWIISYIILVIPLLMGDMNSTKIDLAPNVWLHSSFGRLSHRYFTGGHGFESRWSTDFFRLLLSNCLNWKIYCHDHSSLLYRLL